MCRVMLMLYRFRVDRVWSKIDLEHLSETEIEILRTTMAKETERLSDNMLDAMIGSFGLIMEDGQSIARTNEKLKAIGIDWLQELKNEKFLREHRRKHEKLP